MMNDEQFQEIRPYRDHEFAEAIKELLNTPQIDVALQVIYPETAPSEVKEKIKKIPSIKEFQQHIIYDVLLKILKTTTRSFTFSGTEFLVGKEPFLYISNHRDIALDPSLISFALVENGLEVPEIAIGDNLLKEKWIKDLVRINKSFIVKRNLPPRELVLASKVLSQYIYHTISGSKQSVWIAQREGRAKDGNDITQSGLLGMLSMSATGGIIQHFEALNPVSVSVSYEYDPTDAEKVRRIYAERFLGGYKKEHKEDEISMRTGILGNKGGVHIHFGEPLKDKIGEIPHGMHKSEVENQIRSMLDYQIITGYKLWPANYIAMDLFLDKKPDEAHYSEKQKVEFVDLIEKKLSTMNGDKEKLRMIFYEIYGRPAINKSKIAVSDKIFNA